MLEVVNKAAEYSTYMRKVLQCIKSNRNIKAFDVNYLTESGNDLYIKTPYLLLFQVAN